MVDNLYRDQMLIHIPRMTFLTAGELMSEKLERISTISSAQEASKKMRDKNVSSLVVIEANNNKPMGIVTERDLVRKACVRDIGAGNIPIKDIMSTLPLVAIDSRSPVEAAANTMIQNKVRHLLVINDNDMNKIVGIITPTDFVGYLKENLNVDNELNAKLLEFLREPRGEDVVQELEKEGRLRKSSQIGGQKYEDEKPRQG
jgi:CBS domain-containing protein